MPIRKIVMVRRRADLSPEAFREGYENSHSRMAVALFGHLWLSYRRNYLLPGPSFAGGESVGPDVMGFDAVSEFVLRDEAAALEMRRIGAANLAMIKEDEARWFDQTHSWAVNCESFDEDLSACGPG